MTTLGRTLAEAPAPGPVPYLEIPEWREHGFTAGITTRGEEFDLGLFGPGRAGRVLGNWLKFHQAFDRRFPAIAVGQQVHGNTIRSHETLVPGWQVADGVDGHATSHSGLLLSVTVADCVPLYLAHPASRNVALLHAGWRGIAGGILEAGVSLLTTRAKTDAAALVMHCGVGICGDCYEVGHEVIAAVTGRHGDRRKHIDLRGELVKRADRLGIRRVTTSSWCSAHHADQFFSHRRSGGNDGRMLAFLGVPAE